MPKPTVETRLKVLEQQVAELAKRVPEAESLKDWRSTIGMFTGDEIMKRIDESARQFRDADRRKARQRVTRRRAKS
jgi:hypothetical protein